MAAATMTTISAVVREVLLPAVVDQLNNLMLFRNVMRKSRKVTKVGRSYQANIALRVKRPQGIGVRAAGETLPTAKSTGYLTTTVTLTRNYARLSFDRPTLKSGNLDAIAQTLDTDMEGVTDAFALDEMRQMMLDGSGAMCRISTTGATGTTFVVDDSRYLEPGMVIDAYAAKTGGSATIDSVEITTVDYNTHTVVLPSCTWGTNDYVFREDNRGLEANGLSSIIDDGTGTVTLQGLSRSSYPIWKANLVSGAAGPLSIDMLLQAYNTSVKVGGKEPNFIGSDYDSQRMYVALLSPTTRHVNTLTLKGGFQGLGFTGGGKEIGWFVDRYFPSGSIYFMHTPSFVIVEMGEAEWVDDDGAVLSRISDVDEVECYLAHYWQLAVDRCNVNTRLYNYVSPATT
jgi:hypothetical protein